MEAETGELLADLLVPRLGARLWMAHGRRGLGQCSPRRELGDGGRGWPSGWIQDRYASALARRAPHLPPEEALATRQLRVGEYCLDARTDRKSTRLNSSHLGISY